MGAQKMSANSPRMGIRNVKMPMKSITIEKKSFHHLSLYMCGGGREMRIEMQERRKEDIERNAPSPLPDVRTRKVLCMDQRLM